ncbi:MAG TPA: hypothetical protein VFZ59_16210 [Verrucomicrobiae bacterium]|nr:hypothetical protein [Verrucomicrobiae bacterium]
MFFLPSIFLSADGVTECAAIRAFTAGHDVAGGNALLEVLDFIEFAFLELLAAVITFVEDGFCFAGGSGLASLIPACPMV